MNFVRRIKRFYKFNKQKKLTILCYIYSAWFRFIILHTDSKKMQKNWGIEGEESPQEELLQNYQYANKVGSCVNRICKKTAWESKCLVRALTAQKLLKRKNIHSTLYLGCATENGKMIAHAWLRCGSMYVTGGEGIGYVIVDKFRI